LKMYTKYLFFLSLILLVNCALRKIPSSSEINPYWKKVELPFNLNSWGIMNLDFFDTVNGWAVGIEGLYSKNNRKGFILKFDGSSWNFCDLPEISNDWILWGIKVINPYNIWAVGADFKNNSENPDALIIHYNGTIWEKTIPDDSKENIKGIIKSIDFSNDSQGWAVGTQSNRGVILNYKNSEWKIYQFEKRKYAYWGLTSVVFDKGNSWWISGWDISSGFLGFLLKFENNEWVEKFPEKIDFEYSINSFYFVSPNDGWAAGRYQITGNLSKGLILRYENNTWYKWGLAGHPFNDVEFFSVFPIQNNELWAAGGIDLPYIAHYRNISKEYEGEFINLKIKNGIIRSIYFTSKNTGWAAGADFSSGESKSTGLILKYEKLPL
ncbi:hypothetical protein DRQ09_09915, partial [candidate division KSB1 bacterium]